MFTFKRSQLMEEKISLPRHVIVIKHIRLWVMVPHYGSICKCTLSCLSCLTLCHSMDFSLPGSSVHGDSPGKNTGVGCHALLQGIFLTQGSNPSLLCLLHCRRILYCWATREAHLNIQWLQLAPKWVEELTPRIFRCCTFDHALDLKERADRTPCSTKIVLDIPPATCALP